MELISKVKSGIHIKKENKGKFTKYCNGKVTSECIARGKKSNDPTVRKRATFAANARKWKHESGSKIHKPTGHNLDNVVGNGWTAEKTYKKAKKKLIKKHLEGGIADLMTKFLPVDWQKTNINVPSENFNFELPTLIYENIKKPTIAVLQQKEQPKTEVKESQSFSVNSTPVYNFNKKFDNYDIEDLMRELGFLTINGKTIKYGSKAIRPSDASYGSKQSHHKEKDPITGNANARDISIIGGTLKDYEDLKQKILNTPQLVKYLQNKKWGIINEVTNQHLSRTKGTGLHFHFGPDQWANRIFNYWVLNPNTKVDYYIS